MTAGMVGLNLLDPIAAVGVLVWDIWDHYHTVQVERPVLQQNLEQYLSEMKDSLLNDQKNGLLSSIYSFHSSVLQQLASQT